MTVDGYAKAQIAEMLHRAAYALDHKDMGGLAACFHKDARFALSIDGVDEVSEFDGLEAIMGLMKGALDAQTDVRRHAISNLWYEHTGEATATAVSYLSLFATENGTTRLITTGIYRDKVAKASIDGGWVLMARNLHLDSAY